LPLLFENEADYGRVNQGDAWRIESACEAIASGGTELVAKGGAGGEIKLEARLLLREREILLSGGTLKYLRESGQRPIGVVEGDSASAESGGPESGGRS
jgi:hypothetical protein